MKLVLPHIIYSILVGLMFYLVFFLHLEVFWSRFFWLICAIKVYFRYQEYFPFKWWGSIMSKRIRMLLVQPSCEMPCWLNHWRCLNCDILISWSQDALLYGYCFLFFMLVQVNMNEKDYQRKKNKFLPKIHAWYIDHAHKIFLLSYVFILLHLRYSFKYVNAFYFFIFLALTKWFCYIWLSTLVNYIGKHDCGLIEDYYFLRNLDQKAFLYSLVPEHSLSIRALLKFCMHSIIQYGC